MKKNKKPHKNRKYLGNMCKTILGV